MQCSNISETAPPFVFRDVEAQSFRARPKQMTFDFARKHMRMIDGPLKGLLWNPDLTPHARGIMDAFDNPGVRKIYFLAPSQSGKTTIGFSCFFSALVVRPDNWGIGMPDIKQATSAFQSKLHKYFETVTPLKALLKKDLNALQATEILLKDSEISAMWAGSEGSMRSKPMPYVLPDEPDAYPDPAALNTMQERADAYHVMELSKIFIPCRPKGSEDQSVTWTDAVIQAQAWMQYAACCPACMTLQIMDHGSIVPVDGSHDPKRIRQEKLGRYQCAECKYLWNDSTRNAAMRAGQWVNMYSAEPVKRSRKENDYGDASIIAYHFRSWESPLVSLSDVLADWFEAQKNSRLLQLFDNNRCAKPYKFVQVEAEWEALRRFKADHLGHGEVPEWAAALTFYADMQMDHFYWSVAAHSADARWLHIVDYGKILTWEELKDTAFDSKYAMPDGRVFGIWRGGLDTGGGRDRDYEDSRTMQAYQWLMAVPPGVIFGTKGMSRRMPGTLVDLRKKEQMADGRKLRDGFSLHFIDTDAFKRAIFWSLAEGKDEEPITFHGETDDGYLKQIASEKLQKERDGREVWKKIRDNHYLDCLVGHKALVWWQWKPSLAQMAMHAEAYRAETPQPRNEETPGGLFNGNGLFGGER